jgi:predicted HicB family RNase H-like nuclease
MKSRKKRKKGAARDYLRVVEWSAEDQCFVGSAPPLIGRCCHGATEAGVLKQLKRIVDEWIRLADRDGTALPTAERSDAYSGRFVLRVPPPVHQALALKARAAGKSLNAYCAEKLAAL